MSAPCIGPGKLCSYELLAATAHTPHYFAHRTLAGTHTGDAYKDGNYQLVATETPTSTYSSNHYDMLTGRSDHGPPCTLPE